MEPFNIIFPFGSNLQAEGNFIVTHKNNVALSVMANSRTGISHAVKPVCSKMELIIG